MPIIAMAWGIVQTGLVELHRGAFRGKEGLNLRGVHDAVLNRGDWGQHKERISTGDVDFAIAVVLNGVEGAIVTRAVANLNRQTTKNAVL